MIVDLSPYGYKSRAAFLRDENPAAETMQAMSMSEDWRIQKSVLLHKACPLAIRDMFSVDPTWYKRFVAIFASKAPEGYINKAEADMDKRIQTAYKRYIKAKYHPTIAPES